MGIPQGLDSFHGKSRLEMDDDWGYPYDLGPPRYILGGMKIHVPSENCWVHLGTRVLMKTVEHWPVDG